MYPKIASEAVFFQVVFVLYIFIFLYRLHIALIIRTRSHHMNDIISLFRKAGNYFVTQHCTASLLLLIYLLHAVGMYIIAGQSLSRIIVSFMIFVGQDNVKVKVRVGVTSQFNIIFLC